MCYDNDTRNLMKKIPLEILIVFLPCVIFLILSLLFFPKFLILITLNMLDLSGFQLIIEGGILKVLGISFLILSISSILSLIFLKKQYSLKDLTKSFCYFLLLVGVPGFFYSSLAFYLFTHADIPKVIEYSKLFSHYDKVMFGTDIFFIMRPLEKIPLFEFFVLHSYSLLVPICSVCALGMYIFKPLIFRRFIASFFLAMALGIPMWHYFPAVAPASLYLTNIFRLHLEPEDQQAINNDRISPLLREKLTEQNNLYFDPTLRNINTSSNPSMHAAWGFIIFFYLYMYSKRLVYIAGIYSILNVLGALYVGQHFGIDILTGICIAILSIYTVEKIFTRYGKDFLETPYYTVSYAIRGIIYKLRY